MTSPVMLTPAEAAVRWGIPADKVRHYIATGQLQAVDFSLHPGGKRPRWKIPVAAIEAFEQARSNTSPAPKPQRRRRKPAVSRREWF